MARILKSGSYIIHDTDTQELEYPCLYSHLTERSGNFVVENSLTGKKLTINPGVVDAGLTYFKSDGTTPWTVTELRNFLRKNTSGIGDSDRFSQTIDLTNIPANSNVDLFFDAKEYDYHTFQIVAGSATDQITVIVSGSWQDDGTPNASKDYDSIMQAYTGQDSFVDSNGTVSADTKTGATAFKVNYSTSDTGGGDQALKLHVTMIKDK